MSEATLSLESVERVYAEGERRVEVLRGVDLAIAPGEIVGLIAPSGAGKSTLLHIAGLLDKPSAGEVTIAGRSMGKLDDGKRTAARRAEIGFVYQFHHLLPEFTALENIALPLRLAGSSSSQSDRRAAALLDRVGLADRARHRPSQMSGGEQQRTALCRALANEPRLLLADEPTGNLDIDTSELVFGMMTGLVRETGLAALIATHNLDLARRMDRVVRLDHGRVLPA